jgi:DNA-binding NtrC family response regulator
VNSLKAKDLILVVDDDLDFLDLVSTLLRDEGYEVETAKSGQEALKKSMEKIYSLTLIDIKLPDFEGIELLERMVETDPKMRKVIVTGYQTLENTRRALNKGADAYLVKPLKAESILETVRRQLAERDKEFKEKYILLEGSRE